MINTIKKLLKIKKIDENIVTSIPETNVKHTTPKKYVKRVPKKEINYDIPNKFLDDDLISYNNKPVKIQGIWDGIANIKYEDGITENVLVDDLKKVSI